MTKDTILYIIISALVLTVGVFIYTLGKKNDLLKISETNLEAALHEADTLRLKNGELMASRQSYITSINELNKYIDITKKEVKELQRKLDDKVMYISRLESKINIKPAEVHDTVVVYKDSVISFSFRFSDKWYSLNGTSNIINNKASTKIDNITMDVPLKVGLTDSWKIFVTSSNPYVSFGTIEGVLIDKRRFIKKPTRVGISLGAGVGIGYDLTGKDLYLGPGVYAGMTFKLF